MASQLSVEQRHPELFTPDKNIDRQHGVRTVPMEVMNLGFPRTGTMCTYDTGSLCKFLLDYVLTSHALPQLCKLPLTFWA